MYLAHMHRLLADNPARDILQFEVFEMPRAVVGNAFTTRR